MSEMALVDSGRLLQAFSVEVCLHWGKIRIPKKGPPMEFSEVYLDGAILVFKPIGQSKDLLERSVDKASVGTRR